MATVTLQGNAFDTQGELPKAGSQAPAFILSQGDLSDLTLADLAGKRVILNIFPSVDTATCATSVRKFNEKAAAILPYRVLEKVQPTIEIVTSDVNATLAELLSADVSLSGLQVRARTLEDLFIELTGKELRA